MKKSLIFLFVLTGLMACVSTKTVLNPECLELDKELAELKNEKKFNKISLLTKVTLSASSRMVNESSLDKEIRVLETQVNECNE